MSMTKTFNRAIALTAFSCLAVTALSPAYATSKRVEEACKGDYLRLCPSYKIGSPAMRACMERRGFELSSRCVDALIETGEVSKSEVLSSRTKK